MRAAQWQDYELIDTLDGGAVRAWGDILLIADPQIIWSGKRTPPLGWWPTPGTSAPARGAASGPTIKVPEVWKIQWEG